MLLVLWVRFSFVGTVATLGGGEDQPFSTSWRLSGVAQLPLTGRLLLLAFLALNVILAAGVLGTPFTALAGGGGNVTQSSDDTLILNDLLGPNPAVFAIGSLFNALGVGLNYLLAAIGTTLLYLKLNGPVPEADPDDESGGFEPTFP